VSFNPISTSVHESIARDLTRVDLNDVRPGTLIAMVDERLATVCPGVPWIHPGTPRWVLAQVVAVTVHEVTLLVLPYGYPMLRVSRRFRDLSSYGSYTVWSEV
jgi:hypothetical protein